MLSNIFKIEQIKYDDNSANEYGRDWTYKGSVNPKAIVFPSSKEQIKELISFANKDNEKIVPSGGRTGLSWGAVATQNEIVVSMEKLNSITNVDNEEKSLSCQAGAITQNIQNAAQQQNLLYPVNFASSGSSHIGGNVATNAGGVKVIKYGSTRNWVSSLSVITGNGTELHLNKGLKKNNSAYDLRNLFIGSEGTLGLITDVELHLCKNPPKLKVLLVSFNEFESLQKFFNKIFNQIELYAFEFFCKNSLCAVLEKFKIKPPLSPEMNFYVIVEFEAVESEKLLEIVEKMYGEKLIRDAVIASSEKQNLELWGLRENISESIAIFNPVKYDLSIKRQHLNSFIKEIKHIFKNEDSSKPSYFLFGHLGDNNIHLNLIPEPNKDIGSQKEKRLFDFLKRHNGSISAEHGIGLLKKQSFKFMNNKNEIDLMMMIKKDFDPNNIMNPGKIFDLKE